MYILCVEEYIGEFIGETVAGTMNLGLRILLMWLHSSMYGEKFRGYHCG
jgi:hypothetical protein